MESLYYWHGEWDRVVIRPDDLRAFEHRLSASVGSAHEGEEQWRLFPWQDRFQAAGAGSVESQIVELRGRYKTMVSLELLVARTPEEMTLAEVKVAPRREPTLGRKNVSEASSPPISATLILSRSHPGATYEVLSIGRLAGGSVFAFVMPHLDAVRRKAPQPETVGVSALLTGAGLPDALLALDLIGPALALPLVFILGAGLLYASVRFMEWAFPPLELLPDEHTKTRWQKTLTAVTGVVGTVAAITGIVSFILVLGQ
jgi:hypothetical protein